jgi:hypothetical protein
LIKAAGTEVVVAQLTAKRDTLMQGKGTVLLDPDQVASDFTNEPTVEILKFLCGING